MANNRFNKQVSPKGYKKGGSVKKEKGVIEFRTGKKFKKVGPVQKVDLLGKDRVKKMGGGSLKAVQPNQKGLKKLPTEVRNKMGYMKKGGVVSDAKKKQFKENKAGQKSFNKKAMKIAKGVLNFAVPAVGAAEVGKKIARKFKGAK